MSKYRFQNSPIYYPQTDIPINKLNIRDKDLLHAIERELLQESYRYFIERVNETSRFDERFFRQLHEKTLASLYDWAGVYRNMDMSKGESLFCKGAFVCQESERIFERLAQKNFLHDTKDKEELGKELGNLACDLIALHPFYEVNGRITRLFLDLIAIANGFLPIDYSNYSPQDYIDASIECVNYADASFMTKIITDGLNEIS